MDPLDSKRPAHAGVKRGTLLKSVYLSAVVLSRVKMVADIGTAMLLIIKSTGDKLLRNVNIDDLE